MQRSPEPTKGPTVVSVVVPTKDNEPTLEACLQSIRNQSIPVELIVVDNHSTDDTPAIAMAYAHRFESAGPERSAQRNRGMALATAPFICFIDSDMELDPGVLEEAVSVLESSPGVGGIIIPELAGGIGYLAACRGLEKELYQGNADVEAARLFPTSVVRSVGGYRADLCGGEDWDLSDRVEASGLRIARTQRVIWHEEGRVRLGECFRTKRYYGQGFAGYLANRTEGRQRRVTRPAVFAHPRLLRSPHLAVGLVVLKGVEVLGLTLGILEGRRQLS